MKMIRLRNAAAVVGMSVAVAFSNAPLAHAGELGGVDILTWCRQPGAGMLGWGQVSTSRDPGNAYSWKCVYGSGWSQSTRSIDMNQACSWQYGRGAWAKPLDPRNAYSWRCYR